LRQDAHLNFSGPQSLFQHQSGRVIALGRTMLAALFLVSIWLDHSQPAVAPEQSYLLLLFYVLFAVGIAVLTWRNWWLDARLAAPAHLLDMAVFTTIVFSTNGYTSPFFLFFILPLLSAAIRWGWRETALTAAALVILYLTAGLLVAGSERFEVQRFIVRSGHLLILSLLLIWFGIHQRRPELFSAVDGLGPSPDRTDDPLMQALRLAMTATGARSGALLLDREGGDQFNGTMVSGGVPAPVTADRPLIRHEQTNVALFALPRLRTLSRRAEGWYRFRNAARLLETGFFEAHGIDEGLVARVNTGTQAGWLVLWDLTDSSVDYLELGQEAGRAVGALLDREALLSAIEQGAAARTRLSLARDVHDSVVQFLAGAAFRVEAMMRGSRSGQQVEAQLGELKRLLIEEQGEIRAFISALRRDRELELEEAVDELRALAARLARQWNIECRVQAAHDHASVPIRLAFDLQQLLREAVANAVRHGGAKRVDVAIRAAQDQLALEVKDDGSGFGPATGGKLIEPWSLKERVDRARGSLSLVSEPGCTNLLITLPLDGAPA
jgi:signal transduction histidine kinase